MIVSNQKLLPDLTQVSPSTTVEKDSPNAISNSDLITKLGNEKLSGKPLIKAVTAKVMDKMRESNQELAGEIIENFPANSADIAEKPKVREMVENYLKEQLEKHSFNSNINFYDLVSSHPGEMGYQEILNQILNDYMDDSSKEIEEDTQKLKTLEGPEKQLFFTQLNEKVNFRVQFKEMINSLLKKSNDDVDSIIAKI